MADFSAGVTLILIVSLRAVPLGNSGRPLPFCFFMKRILCHEKRLVNVQIVWHSINHENHSLPNPDESPVPLPPRSDLNLPSPHQTYAQPSLPGDSGICDRQRKEAQGDSRAIRQIPQGVRPFLPNQDPGQLGSCRPIPKRFGSIP